MREELRQHLETRFRAGWPIPSNATPGPFPVFFENQPTKEDKGETWGRFFINMGKPLPAAVGIKHVRTPGIFGLQVFVPTNKGTIHGNKAADTLDTIFSFQQWGNLASTGETLDVTVDGRTEGPTFQYNRDGYSLYLVTLPLRVDAYRTT